MNVRKINKALLVFMLVVTITFKIINYNYAKAGELSYNTAQAPRPDYGLYWFGLGNKSVKFEEGKVNPYYDPNKPTVIYVHGWEKDTGIGNFRETFNYKLNDPTYGIDINIADAWIKAGWNIGIFYWDMFSR